jgi:AraC family transcriptional regulator
MGDDQSWREDQSGIATLQPQAVSGIWELPGRRIVSWRNWGLCGAGTYNRGSGEGVWQSSQHRLVFSITQTPPMLLQVDGGITQDVRQAINLMSLYPAGPTIRTAGADSQYAQVCWDPSLYRSIAPDLPRLPQVELAITFRDPLLGQLVRTLALEIQEGTMDRLLADSLVAALAMRVAQRFSSGQQQQQRQPDLPQLRLRRVLDYIDANLDQDLTLAELAGVACLSPCHFSRSFKEALGLGPQRYTVRRRIERAKALLQQGDTLADIAATVGFADQSHFTAAFRRETGMTPGRFRSASA